MNEQPLPVDQNPQRATPPPLETPGLQPQAPQYQQAPAQFSPENVLSWQASEYVMREKDTIWFVGLGIVTFVLILVAIFLMGNWTFALLLVVMAVAVFMFARRPARDMNYRLSHESLVVGEKTFRLDSFRAFALIREGGLYSIMLLPVKRFAPGVSLYFPPEYGETIVDLLGSRLPMEEREPDFIDQLTEKLRF